MGKEHARLLMLLCLDLSVCVSLVGRRFRSVFWPSPPVLFLIVSAFIYIYNFLFQEHVDMVDFCKTSLKTFETSGV